MPSQQKGLSLLKELLDTGITPRRESDLEDADGELLSAVGWWSPPDGHNMPLQTGLSIWIVDFIDTVYRRAGHYADAIGGRELALTQASAATDFLNLYFDVLDDFGSLPSGNDAFLRAVRTLTYAQTPRSSKITDLAAVLDVCGALNDDNFDDALDSRVAIQQAIEEFVRAAKGLRAVLEPVRRSLKNKAEEAAGRGRKPAREIDFFVLALLEGLAVISGVRDNSLQTKFVDAVFLVLGHPGGNAAAVIKRLRKADGWDEYMEVLASGRAAYCDLRSAVLERRAGSQEPTKIAM